MKFILGQTYEHSHSQTLFKLSHSLKAVVCTSAVIGQKIHKGFHNNLREYCNSRCLKKD